MEFGYIVKIILWPQGECLSIGFADRHAALSEETIFLQHLVKMSRLVNDPTRHEKKDENGNTAADAMVSDAQTDLPLRNELCVCFSWIFFVLRPVPVSTCNRSLFLVSRLVADTGSTISNGSGDAIDNSKFKEVVPIRSSLMSLFFRDYAF